MTGKRWVRWISVPSAAAMLAVLSIANPAHAALCATSIAVSGATGVTSDFHRWVSFSFRGGVSNMYFEQQDTAFALVDWNTSSMQDNSGVVDAVVHNQSGTSGDFPPGWVVMTYNC